MANNEDDKDRPHVAKDDELGIFIDADHKYRVAVPNSWDRDKEMPQFAYLAVAAILRLAKAGEGDFAKELYAWAKEHVKRDGSKNPEEPTSILPENSTLH